MIAIPLLCNITGIHKSRRGWIVLDDVGQRVAFVDGGIDDVPGGETAIIDWCHANGMLHSQLVTVTRPIRVSQREYERWAADDPPRAS